MLSLECKPWREFTRRIALALGSRYRAHATALEWSAAIVEIVPDSARRLMERGAWRRPDRKSRECSPNPVERAGDLLKARDAVCAWPHPR